VAEETNTNTDETTDSNDAAASDAAVQQAQSISDPIYEQGYLGTKVDPAPNEDYTVAGVIKDATNS
jgi:hypothetical protein